MRQLVIGERRRINAATTLDAAPGADIQATVPPLPPEVKAVAWDYIVMIHFLEHLHAWDARQLLKECYEVLAPGGVLVIELPNIEYCARVLIGEVKPPDWAASHQFDLWGIYGNPDYQDPLYGHKWGYTPGSLVKELRGVGFDALNITLQTARYHHAPRDFRMEAVK